MESHITRRSLAKGAAWSVPVIALASAVPAYAAVSSACRPTLDVNNTLAFDWGNTSVGGTQYLHYSSGVRVVGMPPGVKVVKATVTRWVQQREDGRAAPGVPWPGDSNSSASGRCSASGCSIPFTPLNAGWKPAFEVSPRNQSYTDSNGQQFTGWSITTTFDGTVQGAGSLTGTADGCFTFVTRPSGNSGFNAQRVATYTNNPRTSNVASLRALTERIATVDFSDGQRIVEKFPSVISYNSGG